MNSPPVAMCHPLPPVAEKDQLEEQKNFRKEIVMGLHGTLVDSDLSSISPGCVEARSSQINCTEIHDNG